MTVFQVTSAGCCRGYTTVDLSMYGCTCGRLLLCMKVPLPVKERKIHVEGLVEVKLETFKEVRLQAHCSADNTPSGCWKHHADLAEWACCKARPLKAHS